MADDLSLLFKIRGDAAGAKAATAETRAAVAALRSQLGSDFSGMQKAGESALAGIGDKLNIFVGQRIPLVGGAFVRVTENLRGLGDEAKKGESAILGFGKTIDGLASTTGKSKSELVNFLQTFVQLETQAKRDAAAIETFGASAAQTLIPQLEKAGEEMGQLAISSEGAGAGLAAMATPISIALVGIAALTAGVVLAGKAIYDASVSTAEWQGQLEDLSQQTGVSVETLSALSIVAETTGGNIEAIAASLGIFQKNLEASLDPTSKQAKLFDQLHISTLDTEEALNQTLKRLAEMPEGFRQTSTALELFGRGGKAVLAILKETGGDLDAAKEKFRELGILVGNDTAKKADEFNDQMRIVQLQLRSTTALLVKEVTPQILSALQSISKFLAENKQLFSEWGTTIGDVVRGVKTIVQSEIGQTIAYLVQFLPLLQAAASIANGIRSIGAANRPDAGTDFTFTNRLLPGGDARTDRFNKLANRAIDKNDFEALQDPEKVKKTKDELEKYRTILNSTINSLDQFGHKSEFVRVQDELTAAGLGQLTGKLKEQAEQLAQTALANARLVDSKRDLAKLEEEKKKSDQEILDMIGQQAENIYEARGLTDQYKIAIDHLIASLNGYTPAEKEAVRATLEKNAALEKTLALTRQRIALEQTLIDRLERQRAVTAEVQDRLIGIDHSEGDETRARRVNAPVKQTISEMDKLYAGLSDRLSGTKLKAAQAGVQALSTAFSGLGEAIGQAAYAWVLYGNAGTSIRKVTAEILASIAQQAAVKSVFELAEGLAALFTDPPAAAAHFTSSAVYASVAGVAAVAGRGIAGTAFVQQGNGASAGTSAAGGSVSGGASSTSATQPIVQGSQRMEVVHKIVPPPGWGHTVLVSALNSNDPEINRAIGRERG